MEILVDRTRRFEISVSREGYSCKGDALACLSAEGSKSIGRDKMAFCRQSVSVDDFMTLANSGHAFCGLFEYDTSREYWITPKSGKSYCTNPEYKSGNNRGCMKVCMKRDENYEGAWAVFIDVDYTRFPTVEDYIDTLEWKPTCVYLSYSDGKDKGGRVSRRFHMVYVMDQELKGKEEFTKATTIITMKIEEDTGEMMDDDCGERCSQFMNGFSGDIFSYTSYSFYSYSSLLSYKKEREDNNNNNIHTIPETEKRDKTEENLGKRKKKPLSESQMCSEQMIRDMKEMSYDEYMSHNRPKYQYIYRTEDSEWVDEKFQYVPTNYLKLYYNKEKVMDHQKRRKKLFDRCCIRRLINPAATADQLLFCLYEDREKFFDNSDGVLSIDKLVEKVHASLSYEIEDLEEMYSETLSYYKENAPKIIFKSSICVAERNTVLKEVRYDQIDELYDERLSVKENLKLLKSNGIKIQKTALYEYCKSRGIATKPGKNAAMAIIESVYDSNLSLNANWENVKTIDSSISRRQVYNYQRYL